jgi:hypothetical protein
MNIKIMRKDAKEMFYEHPLILNLCDRDITYKFTK